MASTAISSPVERPKNLSLDTKSKSRVTFNESSISQKTSSSDTTTKKVFSEFRRRKRTHSCSLSWDHYKRRRLSTVLPSKFLLGGNITDPLNLEALDKEDTVASEEGKGTNGRRGSTVRVIIPPNINDPLNLDACSEDGDHQLADAILKQRRRRKPRKRKRRNSEPGGIIYSSEIEERLSTSLEEEKSPEAPPVFPLDDIKDRIKPPVIAMHRQLSLPALPVATKITELPSAPRPPPPATLRVHLTKKTRTKEENKIVSPVVPQPGVERKRHSSRASTSGVVPPVKSVERNLFKFGNYNQYYGYRNGQKMDPRLECFRPDWFAGKEVLDIGCNIGHISLSIGRDFDPYRVVGIDIDKKLINIAKKNIKHYLYKESEGPFPKSMRLLYGPIRPSVDNQGRRPFPHNVKFCQGNYVMENDALLETVRPEFDTILCLSVTKWIHLNWGDEGLKRFFRRAYLNLRHRGCLILEPQGWPSYNKKRKLTPEIHDNYKNIKLFPEMFSEFLTKEVGFSYVQKLSVPQHFSKGFQRPIYVFMKDAKQKEDSSKGEIGLEANTRKSSQVNVPPKKECKSTADKSTSPVGGRDPTTSNVPSSDSRSDKLNEEIDTNQLNKSSSKSSDSDSRVPIPSPSSERETISSSVDLCEESTRSPSPKRLKLE